MNRNPKIVTIVTILIIVVALAFLFWPARSASGGGNPGDVFFSNDDGKSTFTADPRKNVPPFQKDGKETVLAHVFQCADGKKFVGYLERYTPDAKKKVEAANAATGDRTKSPDPTVMDDIDVNG